MNMNMCSASAQNRADGTFFGGWRRLALLMLIVAPVLLTAGPAAAKRLSVVATTGMVADLARAVAGDRAEVAALMGEGVDPHLYKPTRSDMARLLRADVVLINGLRLEGKMSDAFERLSAAGKPVIAVAEGVDEARLIAPPEFAGHHDPHVWMDVALWTQALESTRNALSSADPDGAGTYAHNADAYAAQLRELDAYARRVLGSVPANARVLITAHDAFTYLGRAYGIEVRGIQGISTESEAGLKTIEELVALLAERKVPAVFPETSVSDRNVLALVEGAAARGHTVVLGGALFSDAMGAPGTYEGTYVGMIDHNVTTIARALGGDAPAGGFQGKLRLASHFGAAR